MPESPIPLTAASYRADPRVLALSRRRDQRAAGQTLQTPINEVDVELDPPTASANQVSRGISRVWSQMFGRSPGGTRRIRSTVVGSLYTTSPMLSDGTLVEVNRRIGWTGAVTYSLSRHCHLWVIGTARSEWRADFYADNGTSVIASIHGGTVGVGAGGSWELTIAGLWCRSNKLIINDFSTVDDNRLTLSAYAFPED